MKIVSLFSQTGSEIANLIGAGVYRPDLIVTNKRPGSLRKIDGRLEGKYIELPNRPSLKEYREAFKDIDPNNSVITLHGWLRIIPPELCREYTIVNGHPGLITKYPELKGKDPQIRAFNAKHEIMGGVLHRVTEGVDEGEIIKEQAFMNWRLTEDEMWRLHQINSQELWTEFFLDLKKNRILN